MELNDLIYQPTQSKILEDGSFTWKAPSNIALVKYWGKRKDQVPENPSISFTLDACFTQTTLEFKKREKPVEVSKPDGDNGFEQTVTRKEFMFDVFLDGEKKPEFSGKIGQFIIRIGKLVPFISDYDFVIKTHNSFPHSSGIASSASGMAALALCIMSMEKALNPSMSDELFYKKASFLARLGSGSAARSIEGPIVVWGKHDKIENSSDYFGVKFSQPVHDNFKNYQDTILLVDKGEKQVSSTVGHNLMNNHPYAQQRFVQANENMVKISEALKIGDIKSFINIVESEALTLHSMMMTSHPYFILMKPNTLEIINKIWAFRSKTDSNICFTLDAGANVHVLFPEKEKEIVNQFIVSELLQFCQNNHYICDRVGSGAKQIDIN
ncbi:diphosphomevalonate decarboxylase [Aureibaculum sp. 2210JD6-5]|uniref:diphosphomevalonate/mevalonate 3,5-bisphosphate decarboxylase family protein n=1 Tax=Aureibaculum sp. 2210JD6-5 TaxID=3103957 RepID=UPI002AADD5EC|nr:diphosphomevalonate decarboxylase [Aureibaculum sp. 2210JD6-5]MDY7396844.1 diphosphomevalonate decarboxylase [Aureibaculum sp. 2210JD6-5]